MSGQSEIRRDQYDQLVLPPLMSAESAPFQLR
jgi:hypothetical protein